MLSGDKGTRKLRTQTHSAKLPACAKEVKESFSSEGDHQQQKADAN